MKHLKKYIPLAIVASLLFTTTTSNSSQLNELNEDGVSEKPSDIRHHGFGSATKVDSEMENAPLSTIINGEIDSDFTTGPYYKLSAPVFKQGGYFIQFYAE